MAADEFSLIELIEYIQLYILNEKIDWLNRNFNAATQISFKLEVCNQLKEYCSKIIRFDPIKIFQADDCNLIEKNILLEILQSDMLNINEIDLWENILKWGTDQINIDLDYSKWETSEIITLKELLSDFIPYIRFFDITGSDYWDRIRPYENLLLDELVEDLKRFYITNRPPLVSKILPSRMYEIIHSFIVLPQHLAQFSSWINNTSEIYPLNKIPYKFELIYQGNRDGLNNITGFKKKCQSQSKTIIVIKVANKNKLIGGYNPFRWDFDNTWTKSNKSFIFSIDNNKELTNSIFSLIKNHEYAISDAKGKDIGFGHDLEFFDGGRYEHIDYDKKILNDKTFEVEDFEVFKLDSI
ncbi:432_t:CDS:1 [Diversispora eburnea]|uniref:432_t:CDS:1 n=1 Tax=Diversispora eburnea TaxID=1213867 RepID=A0A9N9A9G8_9GLOM|nr:432_t:CDS:1 [Diversispora eburnea]